MSTNLDQLFNQILHSEQKAQERKNILNEVRNENSHVLEKIEALIDEYRSCQGELVTLVQDVNDREQEERELTTAGSILHDKHAQLQAETNQLSKDIENLKKQLDAGQEALSAAVQDFVRGYQLCGGGRHQRALRVREELASLQEMERTLEKELTEYGKKTACVEELALIIQQHQDLTALLQQECQDADSALNREKRCVEDLMIEKELVAKFPATQPQFIRLQEELERNGREQLEAECRSLQAELHQLQQTLWQQQSTRHGNQHQNKAHQTSGTPNVAKLSKAIHK